MPLAGSYTSAEDTSMRMPLLIAGAMIVWLTAGAGAGEPKTEGQILLISAGALSSVRGTIERVLQFRLDGDKLKLDRTSWAAMAKPGPGRFTENTPVGLLFREIQKVAGAFSTAESGGVGEHAMSFMRSEERRVGQERRTRRSGH